MGPHEQDDGFRIAISVVCYAPDFSIVRQTLESLDRALGCVAQHGQLRHFRLFLIDNGPDPGLTRSLPGLLASTRLIGKPGAVELITGHGNVGFGAGHNLTIHRHDCDYHLVLNPDVLLERTALLQGLDYLARHPAIGILAPSVCDGAGNQQYLCKRYPSVLDLLLRGFAPPALRSLFRKRLDRYELRDLIGGDVVLDVPIVSGCFMLFRSSALREVAGFSQDYFLYFEDFDLSLRLAEITRIAYVPAVKITHFGGQAARKGKSHVKLFARSALTFFNRHGWKWL
jgi:GT2 family glycosyltransferase